MYSTMQNVPLTVAAILRYAATVHGDRTVTTATGNGYRHASYHEVGQQAARLAHALRRLGVEGDDRVGTFMWNNQEHLEAYVAVPSMGAVLHTLNIRLFPEQIEFVAYEAEDRVVIADLSLAPVLAPVLRSLETVHTVIAVGEGDLAPFEKSVDRRRIRRVRLARHRRELRCRNVLHQRHHWSPEGRRLRAPFELPALDGGLRGQRTRAELLRQGVADRADVPRQCLGSALCRPDGRR